MKRSWVVIVAVVVVGFLAGLAIAGRPTDVDESVIAAPASTDASTTTLPTGSSTTGPTPSTTQTSSTSSSSTTTTVAVDRSAIRVVVGNGSDTSGVATAAAEALRALGYVEVTATDANQPASVSVVYFRPGFEDSASVVSADLGWPADVVAPLPANPVTGFDDKGDVIVVIGADRAG